MKSAKLKTINQSKINTLICNACKIEKLATKEFFYFRKDTGTWRKRCRACCDLTKKKWEAQNIHKISAWRKQWHDKYNKEYYHNNIEKERARTRNRPKDRVRKYEKKRKSKPQKRIRNNISRSISYYMNGAGGKKGLSHIKYVDWTYEKLLCHIESQFESWMNWDNYGKYNLKTWDDNDSSTWTWQIDHIIPHSRFKYSSMDCDEFRKCWALENLRPYSAKQNILEGSRKSNEQKR